jgi:hypothetical protein
MCRLTIMSLDRRARPKQHSIRLMVKNFTKADLKLHSYVSSAPPLSQLPDMLSRSNEDATDNLDFELPKNSGHGIWIRYRYVGNEERGFDVQICARFSKPQGIVVNTSVYYIDNQEIKILSPEANYVMYDTEETTRYQVVDSTFDEEVERANDTVFGADVQYGIVNADGWDLCAAIEVQFLMATTA